MYNRIDILQAIDFRQAPSVGAAPPSPAAVAVSVAAASRQRNWPALGGAAAIAAIAVGFWVVRSPTAVEPAKTEVTAEAQVAPAPTGVAKSPQPEKGVQVVAAGLAAAPTAPTQAVPVLAPVSNPAVANPAGLIPAGAAPTLKPKPAVVKPRPKKTEPGNEIHD